MRDSKNIAHADKIVETLKNINVKRIRKLAKCDGDFKAVLELVDACKKSLAASKKKKINWLNVARALVKKIMSYDPLHINFVDKRRNINCINKKRKDRTWCMWLTWDAPTEIGTMSGYSLVSEHANSNIHEDAAKSFVENFCHVGPDCLKIYNNPYTHERQRLANAAIVAVYKELGCPKIPEEVMDKLALD